MGLHDDRGHVVTNDHVVDAAGADGKVSIELTDGTRLPATVVGRDSSYDPAVLKVAPGDLKPLSIGTSGDVVVGDEVVAVGSPLGLGSTVTAGIVSALERPVTAGEAGNESFISAIQTDAAINPGNSGGPLPDGDGNVIGVNSAIARVPGQGQASGSIGVGFAIPSDVVVRTVDQLIATGKAVHPMIGVSPDRRWSGEGAKVLQDSDVPGGDAVVPGGPADDAGIKPGDLITEMDGRRITDLDQLITRIRAQAVGDKVTLTVRRDGKDRGAHDDPRSGEGRLTDAGPRERVPRPDPPRLHHPGPQAAAGVRRQAGPRHRQGTSHGQRRQGAAQGADGSRVRGPRLAAVRPAAVRPATHRQAGAPWSPSTTPSVSTTSRRARAPSRTSPTPRRPLPCSPPAPPGPRGNLSPP
uniref:Trypsin-like peptidase domain-containing protein n=1 Tax=Janibacter limosus TaxID=53458 RepID=A0AC61U8P5_9MICO|nr:trypsin-like peptidase domain-containing protein [Janibacter limosus]